MEPCIWGPTTKAIHAGRELPLGLQEAVGGLQAAAWVMAALEGAERALFAASGKAVLAAVFEAFLTPGCHVVAPARLHADTDQVLCHWEAARGVSVTRVGQTLEAASWCAALRPETALILVETPSFCALDLTDLAEIVQIARSRGIRTLADNTLATPILTRPCEWGVDLSFSRAEAFLGGHHDIHLGVLAGSHVDLEACEAVAFTLGSCPDPMQAWLLARELKTLSMRIRRACDNAQSLAQWLLWQSHVEQVDYPGLVGHAGHGVAVRQMSGGFGGAVLRFKLRGGGEAAERFCSALEIVQRSSEVGGAGSLIWPERSKTEALDSQEAWEGVLRFSVGIEEEADLKADLERGFQAAAQVV